MTVSAENRERYRAIAVSREVKSIFGAIPERFAKMLLRRFFLGRLLRWLFLAEDGELHRAGEIVLAELREEAGLSRPTQFDPDPAVMAYRLGKRDMVLVLLNYLKLDESSVRYIMELDDGLE